MNLDRASRSAGVKPSARGADIGNDECGPRSIFRLNKIRPCVAPATTKFQTRLPMAIEWHDRSNRSFCCFTVVCFRLLRRYSSLTSNKMPEASNNIEHPRQAVQRRKIYHVYVSSQPRNSDVPPRKWLHRTYTSRRRANKAAVRWIGKALSPRPGPTVVLPDVEYCNNHRLSGCVKYRSPEDSEGSRLCVWTAEKDLY